MATIERRNKRFRVIFYFQSRRYAASLKTEDAGEADSIAGSIDRTLSLIEQGVLDVPDEADFVTFVLSGGKKAEKPKLPPVRSFSELKERYLNAHSLGTIEKNSLGTIRMHLGHFVETLGDNFSIQTLALDHLQQHVERRAKDKGFFNQPISPVTLRKEVASFRACWNWGVTAGLIKGVFPGKGLRYPKTTQKPPFQTWDEIERQIARGGLSAVEIKQLWDCLFLDATQISDFLALVKANARHLFLFPLIIFAAHTGARRSEMMRARIGDVDGGSVVIHEKKRAQGKRTHRRVPLSPLLEQVLRDWIGQHPGGQILFCHQLHVVRSKAHRTETVPLTRNEANDHYKRTVAGSKWEVLKGWHVLRHSFVSNCAAKGVDQRMIDEWVGHQTEEMRKRYRHLFPDQQRQAIRSVFA